MKIGELLKEYRLKQGKSQRAFIGTIVTQSYYSKVEKNNTQLTANNLIDLLHYNEISVQKFFSKFDEENSDLHHQIKDIEDMIIEAYYTNNIDKMNKVKKLIYSSKLNKYDQKSKILLIDGFLALMDPSLNNKELISSIKNKIFDIPSFSQEKLMLYCNFMRFYSLEDNEIITKTILRQYQDTKNSDIQELILAIVCNIIIFSIENNDFNNISYFTNSVNKIKTTPKLLFYKLDIDFFNNLIEVKRGNVRKLKRCEEIIDILSRAGMSEYSKELQKFIKNNF